MPKISFQDAPVSGRGDTLIIPDDVMSDVEEAFAYLNANPGKVAHMNADNPGELNTWFKFARAYVRRRPDGNLKLRRLPSKHLPDTEARFTLTIDDGTPDAG